MNREIITVQVGTYSNFVGAHFWNLQDEYLSTPFQQRQLSTNTFLQEVPPSSRFYSSGSRYVPRLQIIDASGAFGALSSNAGYVLPSREAPPKLDPTAWHAKQQRIVRDPVPHSAFIKHMHSSQAGNEVTTTSDTTPFTLDDVSYWSDYLQVGLHNRTCFELPGTHYQVENLEHFKTGSDIAKPIIEDVYNDLRHFLEDCDFPGGIVLSSNADDAYAGFTSSYIDYLVEDLGSNMPIMAFGVHNINRSCTRATAALHRNPFDGAVEKQWSTSEAQLVANCLEYNAEYIPLSSQPIHNISKLRVKKGDIFQTSAALSIPLSVALSPLQNGTSLPALFASIRPKPSSTFGGMLCNFPRSTSRFEYGPSLAETNGTCNLSSVWKSTTNRGVQEEHQPSQRAEAISARGFEGNLPVSCIISEMLAFPASFPSIGRDHNIEENTGRDEMSSREGVQLTQLSALSGLAHISKDAREALRELGKSLNHSTALEIGIEEADLHELSETLKSRADDFMDY